MIMSLHRVAGALASSQDRNIITEAGKRVTARVNFRSHDPRYIPFQSNRELGIP